MSETDGDGSDQYDTLLRAMEEGLLIGINNTAKAHALPLGESRVRWSYDDHTEVAISGPDGDEYQIHRDRRGDLIYSEVTEDGLSYQDEVLSLEVFGLAE